MSLELGSLVHNRYRVAAQVATGKSGIIYRAWDTKSDVACLVMELLAEDPESRQLLREEAIKLQALNYTGIQKVLDVLDVPGQGLVLVLEFVEGQTLQEIQKLHNGVLPEKEAVLWVSQVGETLDYLHAQNPPMIHGDIHPQHIVINKQGKAVLVNSGITSPDYSTHRAADVKSDIYSLGATLYALLTGVTPPEYTTGKKKVTLQPVSQLTPAVSVGVGKAVEHALSMDAGDGFLNINAFKNALLGGLALISKSKSSSQTERKVSLAGRAGVSTERKHPDKQKSKKWLGWAIGGGVVVLLAMAACLVFTVIGLRDGFPSFLSFNSSRDEIVNEDSEKTEEPEETEEAALTEIIEVEEVAVETEVVVEEAAASGYVIILHPYTAEGATALNEIVTAFRKVYPDIYVDLVFVAYNDLPNYYRTSAAAGTSPSLVITSEFTGFELYNEGLVQDISSWIDPEILGSLNTSAVESTYYEGGMMGLPINISGTLLYRNTTIIPEPAENWDDLISKAIAATTADVYGLYYDTGFYFSGGNLYGMGGMLLDPVSEEPAFNDKDGIAWLTAMHVIKDIGLPYVNYAEDDLNAFQDGKAGMIIDGSWSVAQIASYLGISDFVIDPWPDRMSGFMATDGIFLSSMIETDEETDAAKLFMEYMVSEEAQTIWAETACANYTFSSGVPVKKTLFGVDPLVKMAMDAFEGGTILPYSTRLGVYWSPINDAILAVMNDDMTPDMALQQAYDTVTK